MSEISPEKLKEVGSTSGHETVLEILDLQTSPSLPEPVDEGSASNESEDLIVRKIPRGLNTFLHMRAPRPECCIYRVPRSLRDRNREAYTPQMVSIGPFHYGTLKPMQKYKERYLEEFCVWTKKSKIELKNQIEKKKKTIYFCYEESWQTSFACDDSFVEMILLDSVFVIEYFLRIYTALSVDPLIGKSCLQNAILKDLILLENQLPYFMLKDLYDFAIFDTRAIHYPSFFTLTCDSLLQFMSPPKTRNEFQEKEFKHFTDLLRSFRFYHPLESDISGTKDFQILYSATKLYEAGVNFKASVSAWPQGLAFQGGTLTLPQFDFYDDAEVLLRNLMAFEQCHYPDEEFVCSYIFLLDNLVDTDSDVDLLVQKGIITHGLGHSKAVAELMNNLCMEISCNPPKYYRGIAKGLNDHHSNCRHKTMAILKHVYFSDLW